MAAIIVVGIVVVGVVATSVVVVEVPATEAGGASVGGTPAVGRGGTETRAPSGEGVASGGAACGVSGLPPPQDTANKTAAKHSGSQILRLTLLFLPSTRIFLITPTNSVSVCS